MRSFWVPGLLLASQASALNWEERSLGVLGVSSCRVFRAFRAFMRGFGFRVFRVLGFRVLGFEGLRVLGLL